MNMPARDAYLTTQVMTATPQKLQLLLIDAALRSAQQAQRHWSEGNDQAADEMLAHATEVVSELLASVGSAKSEISRRLSSLYLFLFRALSEAHLLRDEQKLADVMRVLRIERETWSLVCEKFGATTEAEAAEADSTSLRELSAGGESEVPRANLHAPHPSPEMARPRRTAVPVPRLEFPSPGGGLSLEA